MSQDKHTGYALANLQERGVTHPSQELVRLELVHIHLEEAACLASLLEQRELGRSIASITVRVRDQRDFIERYCVIAPLDVSGA